MCPVCKTSCCSKTKGVTNPFKCEDLADGSIGDMTESNAIGVKKAVKAIKVI